MKRFFACLLSFALLFTAAFAESAADDTFLIIAELMAENVDIAADSDELRKLFSTPDSIRAILASWAEGDHAHASAVYRIRLDDALLSMLITVDSLPTVVAANLIQRAVVSVITSLNAAYGAQTLAASNIAAISTGFAGTAECCLYILCYEEGADVAVGFYPFDGETYGAYATFIGGKFEENHLADWQKDVPVERLR